MKDKVIFAIAKIQSGDNEWDEELKVSSKESANEEIIQMIKNFNNSKRENEEERSLIAIINFKEKTENTYGSCNDCGDYFLVVDEDDEEYCPNCNSTDIHFSKYLD